MFVVTSFVDSGRRSAGRVSKATKQSRPQRARAGHVVSARAPDERWVGSGVAYGEPPVSPRFGRCRRQQRTRAVPCAHRRATRGCSTLAYPYGVADERIAAAAERAGYLAACTLRFVHSEDERYRRPRVGLSDADVGVRLHAQLSRPALRFRSSVAARSLRRIPRSRSWLPRADVGARSAP